MSRPDESGRYGPSAPVTVSYFPFVEMKCGRPVGEWLDLVRNSALEKHLDVVTWPRAEHGLGHGHANAMVAHVRAEG